MSKEMKVIEIKRAALLSAPNEAPVIVQLSSDILGGFEIICDETQTPEVRFDCKTKRFHITIKSCY